MILVDVLIVLLVVFAAIRGLQRGFISIALDLVGYVLALVIAFSTYPFFGRLLTNITHSIPSFANAAAFGLVFALVQAFYALVLALILHRLPLKTFTSPINRWAGLAANSAKMIVIITVALIVFSGLPIQSSQKSSVVDARIPNVLLKATSGIQERYNQQIGRSLAATLNFLTVKQESNERVELGFTTTQVRLRPELENQMLVLVNIERSRHGLGTLTMNDKARDVARSYSIEMFATGVFAHTDTKGRSPFDRMQAGGVEFGAAGENLALAPTLSQAHTGLMNSPGHRANILSPDFNTVGIGVVDGGPYGLMITQNFTD